MALPILRIPSPFMRIQLHVPCPFLPSSLSIKPSLCKATKVVRGANASDPDGSAIHCDAAARGMLDSTHPRQETEFPQVRVTSKPQLDR